MNSSMRQLIMTLMVVLMSMMASTPVSAKSNKKSVKEQVPENIIVKQTKQFNDGRTLTIYYKKSGMRCEVYSPCKANAYNASDASKIKSTNFEVVDVQSVMNGNLFRGFSGASPPLASSFCIACQGWGPTPAPADGLQGDFGEEISHPCRCPWLSGKRAGNDTMTCFLCLRECSR